MDPHSMDPTKKRKLDENGLSTLPSSLDPTQTLTLTQSDALQILEPFTADQLRDILQSAFVTHSDVRAAVRDVADRDVTQRKLFVRGLGWETTSDSLRAIFAAYGELEEAVVILDKSTGKSKGYGFVTFRHIDGAILALKQPSKHIDGRIAVAALASAGLSGGSGGPGANSGVSGTDTSLRKIYVGNVPQEMSAERLLSVFSSFGEIEEGPLGFDKATGKSKGFALFVYKTVEAAQTALVEPLKVVDGRQLVCKLASEGKKGKGGGGVGPGQGGENMGMVPPSGPAGGPYPGGPGGYSSYSGFSGTVQHPNNPMNPSYNSSVGGQGPGGYGGNAGYGSGGGYGGGSNYGSGPNSGGYGGYGGVGTGLGGAGSGGAGRGGYGMPPNSGGIPSGGGYPDGGHYGLSSGGYPSQQYQSTGASPAPRIPSAGAGGYPNPPPYY